MMVKWFAGWLLAGLFCLAFWPVQSSAWAQELAQDSAGTRYVHNDQGWSITVPKGWIIWGRKNRNFFLFLPPGEQHPFAKFGVRSKRIPQVDTLETFAFINRVDDKLREDIVLGNGMPAIKVLKVFGADWTDLDIFTGKNPNYYHLIASAPGERWDELLPYFERMADSFLPAK